MRCIVENGHSGIEYTIIRGCQSVGLDLCPLVKSRDEPFHPSRPEPTPTTPSADLREWVPADDMVHFVLEAMELVPMHRFKVNTHGGGSRQYHPRMMMALLIYCYANGVFGSRRIEAATYRDIGVRYLCADTHPDHDTICKFRRENFEAVSVPAFFRFCCWLGS